MRRCHIRRKSLPNIDYWIYNLEDFKELRDRINNGTETSGTRFPNGTSGYENKVFALANDIDFNNYLWEGLGSVSTARCFKGTLDGNFNTVFNFRTVDNTSNQNCTYFIYCQGATIKNITIQGGYSLTTNTQHMILYSNGDSHFEQIVFDVDIVNRMNMVSCIIGIDSDSCVDVYNFGSLTVGDIGYNGPSMLFLGGSVERCANYGDIIYDGSYTSASRASTMIRYRGYNNNLVVRNCVNYGRLSNSKNENYGITYNAKEVTNTLYCGVFENGTQYNAYIGDALPTVYSNNFYDNTQNPTVLTHGYNGIGKTSLELKSGVNLFNDTRNWIYEYPYYPRLNNWLSDDARTKM